MSSYSSEDYKAELDRIKSKSRFSRNILPFVYIPVAVIALLILIVTLFFPITRIYGTSMSPTLEEGNYVLTRKGSKCKNGDVIAFYYNNKTLVKRVIANEGDWVNIDEAGNVFVNNVFIEEPYIEDKAFGECNIVLPYQVPENRVFVMGDLRSSSIDSRNTAIGCIAEEQIVGKVLFTLWPLNRFGKVN